MAFEKGVAFPIIATDRFSGQFDKLTEKLTGATAGFGRLQSIVASVAVGGLSTAIVAVVKASEDAAQSALKLEAVLRATGNVTGYTTSQLHDLADALARTSRFDDEAFRDATATLVRFGNIGGANLERVLKLSADYAAVTGGELSSAAAELGRALNAPADGILRLERGFGDLGEETVAAIKLQEDMGNRAGALAIALDALEKKIGGSDQAMNQGLTGSVRGLSKAFSELMESVGSLGSNSAFTGVIDGMAASLRGLKTVLEGNWTLKLTALVAAMGGRGFEHLMQLGNLAVDTPTPGAAGSGSFSLADQNKRGEDYLRKLVEAQRKAAEQILAHNDRLRTLDAAGWVRYIDEMERRDEEKLLAAAKRTEAYYDAKEELRQMDLEGQEWLSKNVVKITEEETRQVEALRQESILRFWDEASSVAGSFFADLVTNGRDAFDNLRQWVKQLLADMVGLFAKRWVLNLAAGGTFLGSAGAAMAGGVGEGSIAGGGLGGILGAASSLLPGGAAGTAFANIANMGASFLGASGSVASAIGSVASFVPVIGAAIAVVSLLASVFGDKGENPNFRWMQGTGGQGAFGGIGTEGNYDFNGTALLAYIGELDRRFANVLGPAGTASASANLAAYTGAGLRTDGQPAQFAFPEGDATAAEQIAKELLQSRYGILFDEIDAEISSQVRNWAGDSTSLQQFIETMLGVVEGLGQLNLLGLNVESLRAMKREGESLDQTFVRVANTWAWFTDNFYTEAEKLEMAEDQVTAVFADLGIAVPESITAFRQLVEGIDLSTEAGRAMWDMLMGVAPAFLTVANATGTAADTITESAQQITDAQRALNEELGYSGIPLAERIRREQQKIVDAKMGLQDYLGGLLLNPGTSPLTLDQRLGEAGSQFERLLAAAQGGDLGAINDVQGAFSSYLDLARQRYGSSGAYNAIFTQGFDALRGIAGGGPTWQTSFQTALPIGSTLASSADIASLGSDLGDVNVTLQEVAAILSRISKGQVEGTFQIAEQIAVSGNETAQAIRRESGGVL
ncbi:MAG: phage tail length tape measure family protein [Burkholderiales bacterium]